MHLLGPVWWHWDERIVTIPAEKSTPPAGVEWLSKTPLESSWLKTEEVQTLIIRRLDGSANLCRAPERPNGSPKRTLFSWAKWCKQARHFAPRTLSVRAL